jgi:hydrogenase expression/formation protein HypE
MTEFNISEGFTCPAPIQAYDRIVSGHGSGGKMTADLIEKTFRKYLESDGLAQGNDAANLPIPRQTKRIAVTTDSHIVSPLFFPGGDIGALSVCGTVNDLLTSGAVPQWLTAGFILEEGFSLSDLEKILASMRERSEEAGIQIVAGDTKVVEHGKGDGIFINTSGVGWIIDDFQPGGEKAQTGDTIILSGTVGDHGMAVLCARGEMGFESDIRSDVAPLNQIVNSLRRAAPHTHVLRDPTRGGLSTTLNEIAFQSHVSVEIDETAVPIRPEVRSICDLLGFDPLYVANEGKMVIFVPEVEARDALTAIRASRYGENAAVIGRVIHSDRSSVTLRTAFGTGRILESLPGEMLPRIC